MSALFKIGRVEFQFQSVDRLTRAGDNLDISGKVTALHDRSTAAAIVDVLASYQDGVDEPFIPVVWDEQPGITGYYRCRSASLTGDRAIAPQGVWDLSLSLERVRGFAAPLLESRILGAKRAGVAGTVTPVAWQAMPALVTGYENGVVTPTVATIASEQGNLTEFTDAGNNLFDATVEFYLPPASWYVGSPSLRVGGHLIAGRQVKNDPTGWVLSNGVVRLSGIASSGSVLMERWTGTAWTSLGNWSFGAYGTSGGPLLPAPHAITVTRNAPDSVSIRLAHDVGSIVTNGRFVVNVDILLRRGGRAFEVAVSSRGFYRWMVRSPFSGAVGTRTTGTGGEAVTATGAAVGNGNTAYIPDSIPAEYALPAIGPRATFGIGWIPGTINEAAVTAWVARYAAAQSERVSAVAR